MHNKGKHLKEIISMNYVQRVYKQRNGQGTCFKLRLKWEEKSNNATS